MTIGTFLGEATRQLAGSRTARLDALVLLSEVLGKDKSWVLAHTDHELSPRHITTLNEQIAQRAAHLPLAYIIGRQEFYGRAFKVTPDVLIPRPDTETLIELAKKYVQSGRIIDVGTGSGAIAITLALELPQLSVEACDTSTAALAVARHNASMLGAVVHLFVSDLLTKAKPPYDAIVANLPYVDETWERSPEVAAEPRSALFAKDGGLALIKELIACAPAALKPGGYVLLEADPRQHKAIEKAASKYRFVLTAAEGFGVALHLI